ncbi:MAG TPA: RDD family protein, partial [Candidatus Dormibacteraeota bacterium]|nr:RDD family protein [Candidatus Dormibacteraeota bacterium]
LMHLVVTDLYGRRVSFGRATGRYFGKIVSALVLFVGYLMIPFSDRRQALHDLMAGTLVVRQEHLALLTAPPRPPEPHGQQGPTGEVQQGA